MRRDWSQARAEGQRCRIVELLEEIADVEPRDQCPKCGKWYENLGAHEYHCEGPE